MMGQSSQVVIVLGLLPKARQKIELWPAATTESIATEWKTWIGRFQFDSRQVC